MSGMARSWGPRRSCGARSDAQIYGKCAQHAPFPCLRAPYWHCVYLDAIWWASWCWAYFTVGLRSSGLMPRSCRADGDNHSDGEIRTWLGIVLAVARATATATAEGWKGCLWVACTSGLTDGHLSRNDTKLVDQSPHQPAGHRGSTNSTLRHQISVNQHPHHRL